MQRDPCYVYTSVMCHQCPDSCLGAIHQYKAPSNRSRLRLLNSSMGDSILPFTAFHCLSLMPNSLTRHAHIRL